MLASPTRTKTALLQLTGDWHGYHLRGTGMPVLGPAGTAPSQILGAVLEAVPDLEGFVTISAKVPYQRILVVFPNKLMAGSSLKAYDGDLLP